jgi:hypothetical protein
LLEEVEAIREVLRDLRDTLGLKRSVRQARHDIATRCSMLWEMLIELEPKYLQRYGRWPEAVLELLQARVSELQGRLEAIGQIVRGSTGDGSTRV